MSASFGENIITTIFGESHGKGIGVVIDGLPAGEKIDMDELNLFLSRRAPGSNAYTTQRKEADSPTFLSGIVDGNIVGSPVCAIIENTNQRSGDYKNLRDVPRPSHADYVAHIKYHGEMDMRGSGPFSGRITAPLCVAGGIALQILKKRGVEIFAHISNLGGIQDVKIDYVKPDIEALNLAKTREITVVSEEAEAKMKELLQEIRREEDSIGAEIECIATGLPIGLGKPNYSSFESLLSRVIFGVPGIRGLSFGSGFDAIKMKGSEHNDAYQIDENNIISTSTNHSGGIIGGISNGMPLVFKVAAKPTASIGKKQKSFSISTKKAEILEVKGRHDPCIALRMVPVIEAVCALVILDLWEAEYGFRKN